MNDISKCFAHNFYDEKIARGLIKREGTPEAIKYFAAHCDNLTDYAYWFFLSTCWVSYSGWYDLRKWKELFASDRPKRELCIMKPSELTKLKQLPYDIKCYRAHRSEEKDWISYTTDIDVAVKMAVQRNVQEIKEYRIKKNQVLAYFTRRGESELIVLDKSKVVYMNTHMIVNDKILAAPIEDTEDIWEQCDRGFDNPVMYKCKRMSTLFKDVYSDGRVEFYDTNAYYCEDKNTGTMYISGLVSRIYREMCPITMPYIPPIKSDKVVCEEFLTDTKNGDSDTVGVLYIVKPDGKKVDVYRYFKEDEIGWEEISAGEYEERGLLDKARKEALEQKLIRKE